MKNLNNRGISLLKMVIIGAVVIVVLGYFNISVRDVVENPKSQENIEYVQEGTKTFWDKYLKDPANYLWHDIWIKLFWNSFVSNMERIRDGKPTDFDNAAPKAVPTQ